MEVIDGIGKKIQLLIQTRKKAKELTQLQDDIVGHLIVKKTLPKYETGSYTST